MENTLNLNSIDQQITELKNLIQKLKESPSEIYKIDRDIALDKVREIYEKILLLETHTAVEGISPETEVPEHKNYIVIEPVHDDSTEPANVQQEAEVAQDVVPADESVKPVEESVKKETLPPSLDLFSETHLPKKPTEKKIIIEDIGEHKPAETIAEKFGRNKISGLNQAIGINEKFFFINELFEGNMKEYKNSIDMLDKKENLARAIEYLETLARTKGWDKSGEGYIKLLDFVERKFQ